MGVAHNYVAVGQSAGPPIAWGRWAPMVLPASQSIAPGASVWAPGGGIAKLQTNAHNLTPGHRWSPGIVWLCGWIENVDQIMSHWQLHLIAANYCKNWSTGH